MDGTAQSASGCFEAQNKNLATLFASSAGGVFSALAAATYRAGGCVGGAVWQDAHKVALSLSESRADMPRLRGAKYALAADDGFAMSVKAALALGRKVFVCAAPCQIAELKKAVGNGDGLLLTADFPCPGIPSQDELDAYIGEWERRAGSKAVEVRFEASERGASEHAAKLAFANGETVYDFPAKSPFLRRCLDGACESAKCSGCPCCGGRDSSADITLGRRDGTAPGDPWQFARNLGVTRVTVRTERGREAMDGVRDSLDIRESFHDGRVGRKKTRHSHGRLTGVWEFFKLCRKAHFRPGVIAAAWSANGLRRILSGAPLIWAERGVIADIRGKVELGDRMVIGGGLRNVPEIPRGSVLLVEKGASLRTGGLFVCMKGARVEVVGSGRLEVGSDVWFNGDAYISCGERIVIGDGVRCGRGVTIRDTNGGHWMNLPGYRNTKSVVIGDHAWLCEGCVIMPGVKIGAGAVVGARSVVFGNIPANTLAMGNPAKVVCDRVEWKD